jgi:hypothetical protein
MKNEIVRAILSGLCMIMLVACGPSEMGEVGEGDLNTTQENISACQPPSGGALVPTMSSNTTPSGIVTRSGVYSSSYEAWQAFDATTATLWLSNMYTSSVWMGYEWGGGTSKLVSSYEIKYANGSCCEQRGPKSWTLQGWNGSAWITVDTVTNQTGWYLNSVRTFSVDNPGCYEKYRLNVTADNYNDVQYPITLISIATIQLYGY